MSKKRVIDTRFWTDTRVETLDPSEKLLFVYLLTNGSVDLCGIYELTIKRMAFEIWFDQDMVIRILERFKKDKKAYHIDGWVFIPNFVKNQSLNPKVIKWISRSIERIPSQIIGSIRKLDRLSIDYIYSITPNGKVKLSYNIIDKYIISIDSIKNIMWEDYINSWKWWLNIMWKYFIDNWYRIEESEKGILDFMDWLQNKSRTTFGLRQDWQYDWDKTKEAIADCFEHHKNILPEIIKKQSHKSRVATWFSILKKWNAKN